MSGVIRAPALADSSEENQVANARSGPPRFGDARVWQ